MTTWSSTVLSLDVLMYDDNITTVTTTQRNSPNRSHIALRLFGEKKIKSESKKNRLRKTDSYFLSWFAPMSFDWINIVSWTASLHFLYFHINQIKINSKSKNKWSSYIHLSSNPWERYFKPWADHQMRWNHQVRLKIICVFSVF